MHSFCVGTLDFNIKGWVNLKISAFKFQTIERQLGIAGFGGQAQMTSHKNIFFTLVGYKEWRQVNDPNLSSIPPSVNINSVISTIVKDELTPLF